jgi:hypothetical protein
MSNQGQINLDIQITQLHPVFYLSYSPFLTWNFFKKYNFSIIRIGIEMKLNIPVHYQMGNPLQQGR